jgi:hypothetical protein
MKPALRIIRPLVLLLILSGAGYLLYELLKDLHVKELVEDLKAMRASQIGLAICLTALNYVLLMGYDWLAIRYIGHALPLGKLAVASFIGHVSSFNLGAMFGGSSMRYRIYSAWKFSMVEIVQLVAILGLTCCPCPFPPQCWISCLPGRASGWRRKGCGGSASSCWRTWRCIWPFAPCGASLCGSGVGMCLCPRQAFR